MSSVISNRPQPDAAVLAGAYPWIPDRGDGTYRNPIIYADYSDPDVIRVGDDFYLTASSFNCTPGLPILHSKDLVNWSIINHAVENLPHPRYAAVQPGCGIWAPSLRFHEGKFWIFFPMPDEGIYLTTADDPAGQWSEPHLVQAGSGLIDPCPMWDGEGKAYLVHAYAGSRAGIKHRLRVCAMAPDGSHLLGEGRIVFHEPEKHPKLEGPKFYRRNGWYYILAPAGGVENGWQVALRSRNIFGPYDDRVILAQGSTAINGPHQGALIDTADDGWWFVHFQDAGVYGRITHLQPVHWKEDWPVMGANGQPVLCHAKLRMPGSQKTCAPQTSDEFDSPRLGRQWQWNANHKDEWYSLTARPGWLRLYAQSMADKLSELPNLLLQKFPARSFTVETRLDARSLHDGETAGLVIAGQSGASLFVRRTGAQATLWLRRDQAETAIGGSLSGNIRLQVRVADRGKCEFGFETGEAERVTLPEGYTATKGVWIGAKAGIYAARTRGESTGGHVDFDYFRFAP